MFSSAVFILRSLSVNLSISFNSRRPLRGATASRRACGGHGVMLIELLRRIRVVGVDPCSAELSEETRIDRLSVGWQFGYGD
jgi:hypothetical protein